MSKAATKEKRKTSEKTDKPNFKPGSFKARLFDVLKDGKPHTYEELAKAIPKCTNPRARLRIIERNGVKLKRIDKDQVQFVGLGRYQPV